jgi:hypothetical protein
MSSNPILLEAIALRKCVVATYNKVRMTLAPHILYTKHDAVFVDAVAIERNGELPRETKLGAYNLAGLKDVQLIDRHFEPDRDFDLASLRYGGVTLFAVER